MLPVAVKVPVDCAITTEVWLTSPKKNAGTKIATNPVSFIVVFPYLFELSDNERAWLRPRRQTQVSLRQFDRRVNTPGIIPVSNVLHPLTSSKIESYGPTSLGCYLFWICCATVINFLRYSIVTYAD